MKKVKRVYSDEEISNLSVEYNKDKNIYQDMKKKIEESSDALYDAYFSRVKYKKGQKVIVKRVYPKNPSGNCWFVGKISSVNVYLYIHRKSDKEGRIIYTVGRIEYHSRYSNEEGHGSGKYACEALTGISEIEIEPFNG